MAVSLDLAISAIKARRKEEGRQLLNLLIQQNPNNEMAWLWMSSVVTTDEQRARCLYHVLSINPKNELAHRGLQVLGIEVSDSRPVQIPRDSQPIHIPKPTAPPAPGSQNGARRPFLIDPATVTKELPFVPVKPPFEQTVVHASPEILSLKVDDLDEPAQSVSEPSQGAPLPADAKLVPETTEGAPEASQPTPSGVPYPPGAVAAAATQTPASEQNDEKAGGEPAVEAGYVVVYPAMETQVLSTEAAATETPPDAKSADQPETRPQPQPEPAQTPRAEIASAQTQMMPTLSNPPQQPEPNPQQPAAADTNLTDTNKLPPLSPDPAAASKPDTAAQPAAAPKSDSQPVQPTSGPQQNGAGVMPGQGEFPPQQSGGFSQNGPPLETRPSQPVYVNYPDPNSGMPQYFAQQPNQMDPSQYGQNQQFQQQQPSMHSASTMAMPFPPGQFQRPPSEPVQVVQTHLGLVSYGGHYPFHSNATILMPTMTEAEARARLANSHAVPTASAAAMPLQTLGGWPTQHGLGVDPNIAYPDDEMDESDEDDGEINVLALIIFGTLSITALGGLGMLVLLIFTAPGA